MSDVQLRRYVVREKTTMDWAEFVIGMNGYFSVVSSYGNYAYRWTHFSEDFRAFLINTNDGYLSGKLSHGRSEYYGDETLAAVKKALLDHRRDEFFDKDRAREEWQLLDEYEQLDSAENFAQWVSATSIGEAHEYAVYGDGRELEAFCERMWPLFVATLRAELVAERGAA